MEGPAPPRQLTSGITPATPQRRKARRSTTTILIVVMILALIVGGGFTASHFHNPRKYVSTDNAQVNGDKIMINAPTIGPLEDRSIARGTALRKDHPVGITGLVREIQGGAAAMFSLF